MVRCQSVLAGSFATIASDLFICKKNRNVISRSFVVAVSNAEAHRACIRRKYAVRVGKYNQNRCAGDLI